MTRWVKSGDQHADRQWIMTTSQAVSAHWPRQPKKPKSTQQSKKSRTTNGFPSSPTKLATSTPVKFDSPSPVKPSDFDLKPDIYALEDRQAMDEAAEQSEDEDIENGGESEEENPFEAFAMTQASQGDHQIKVEVDDARVMEGPLDRFDDPDDIDEEEINQRKHEQDARQHAEESAKMHATQARSEADEYADDELDELFRTTVGHGWVGWQTPTKRGLNGSVTPSSASQTAGSSGGLDTRRTMRDRRMREMAGLGDLSTIMDRSSISLSSPGRTPGPRTPSRTSVKGTPSSLSRNIFAKHRPSQSRLTTPTKPNGIIPPNTVILSEPKRSLGALSSSPEEAAEPATPTHAKVNGHANSTQDVKPDLKQLEALNPKSADTPLPPPQQPRPASPVDDVQPAKRMKRPLPPSPTLQNAPSGTIANGSGETTDDTPKIRKRVRLASPESGLQPTPRKSVSGSQPRLSQITPIASGETRTSTTTEDTRVDTLANSSSTVEANHSANSWQFHLKPPILREVTETVDPEVLYQDPYYSNPSDVPSRPKMFAGRMFALKSGGVHDLLDFESTTGGTTTWLKTRHEHSVKARFGWEYALPSPRQKEVVDWCAKEDADAAEAQQQALLTSQLHKPTQRNKYGFKVSQRKKTKDSEREHQNMSVLAVEVFGMPSPSVLADN